MERKYTKGPWALAEKLSSSDMRQWFDPEGGDLIVIDAPKHGGLAFVVWRMEDDDRSPEKEANAKLIAAAPALLEALQALCRHQEDGDVASWIVEWDHARAAISKSLGETE